MAGWTGGREARWDKDAVTVEIGYALFTGAALGAVAAAALSAPVLLWHLPARMRGVWLTAAVAVGAGTALVRVVRVVRVLRRFDRWRRAGT